MDSGNSPDVARLGPVCSAPLARLPKCCVGFSVNTVPLEDAGQGPRSTAAWRPLCCSGTGLRVLTLLSSRCPSELEFCPYRPSDSCLAQAAIPLWLSAPLSPARCSAYSLRVPLWCPRARACVLTRDSGAAGGWLSTHHHFAQDTGSHRPSTGCEDCRSSGRPGAAFLTTQRSCLLVPLPLHV